MIISLHQIFTSCSSRNTNLKDMDRILPLVKYSLLVVTSCWQHNLPWVQACLF